MRSKRSMRQLECVKRVVMGCKITKDAEVEAYCKKCLCSRDGMKSRSERFVVADD